jgi:hypothetical protein
VASLDNRAAPHNLHTDARCQSVQQRCACSPKVYEYMSEQATMSELVPIAFVCTPSLCDLERSSTTEHTKRAPQRPINRSLALSTEARLSSTLRRGIGESQGSIKPLLAPRPTYKGASRAGVLVGIGKSAEEVFNQGSIGLHQKFSDRRITHQATQEHEHISGLLPRQRLKLHRWYLSRSYRNKNRQVRSHP